jgi:hypothetical protein
MRVELAKSTWLQLVRVPSEDGRPDLQSDSIAALISGNANVEFCL